MLSILYAEACNEDWGFVAERLDNSTSNFKNISQGWRVTGDTVSNLTGPRNEPQTSRSDSNVVAIELNRPVKSIRLKVERIRKKDQTSDGHDKPFCTKAITIIDNFKKALGDTDNR